MKHYKLDAFFHFLLIFIIILPTLTFSQGPSRAQVLQAQNYFTERNLLTQLVSLTKNDPEQGTRFSDVIVACYQIFQRIETVEKKHDKKEINFEELQGSIQKLRTKLDGIPADHQKLTMQITNAVLMQLKANLSIEDSKTLKEEGKKLERILLETKKTADLNRKNIRKTRLISIATTLFICVIAIFSAL